jgi:hypothetical protein
MDVSCNCPDVFPIGSTTVTCTGTDDSGNSASCTYTVTVQDVTPPVAICQDITLQLDGPENSCITADQIDAGSYDNCGITATSLDRSCFNGKDVGEQTVTLTVSDISGNVSGNVSTCTAVVTVVGVRGDLSGDGLVNIIDVMMCVNIILKIEPYTEAADLNGDGVVNIIDLQIIIGIILGS